MSDLISQFRSSVAETGTIIFSDDRIQALLDQNKNDIYQSPLLANPYYYTGSVIYKDYVVGKKFLEGTASGTALVRVYNTGGTVVTDYSADFINGNITFTNDQNGTAYYFTGRNFNFYKAVSEGWREKAAYYSGNFDFRVEGRQFNKSQVIGNCLKMAEYYSGMQDTVQSSIDRGDFC